MQLDIGSSSSQRSFLPCEAGPDACRVIDGVGPGKPKEILPYSEEHLERMVISLLMGTDPTTRVQKKKRVLRK